jgi:hypothetical protein
VTLLDLFAVVAPRRSADAENRIPLRTPGRLLATAIASIGLRAAHRDRAAVVVSAFSRGSSTRLGNAAPPAPVAEPLGIEKHKALHPLQLVFMASDAAIDSTQHGKQLFVAHALTESFTKRLDLSLDLGDAKTEFVDLSLLVAARTQRCDHDRFPHPSTLTHPAARRWS